MSKQRADHGSRRIFGKESTDQILNPDQMDSYIEVTTPRTWLIAAALFLVLTALGFWGFFGRIPRYFETTGVSINYLPDQDVEEGGNSFTTTVMCLADPTSFNARQLNEKQASIVFKEGLRASGSTLLYTASPLSRDEILKNLDELLNEHDWVVSDLGLDKNDFWYMIMINLDTPLDERYWGDTVSVSVVTGEAAPISFLFK